MKKIKYSLFAAGVAAFSALGGTAARAQEHTLGVAQNLPQSMLVNPAMRPERSFLSVPLIGSWSVGLQNSFSYNQVIDKRGDQNYLNTQNLLDAVRGKDLTMLRLNMDLVNTGFFVGNNPQSRDFVGISLRTRLHVATSLPEGLFGMVLDNPIDQYRQFDIGMTPNILGWAELGVSYTRDIDQNWRVGGRIKYLGGLASISSDGMEVTLRRSYDRYTLSGDYSIRGGNIDFSKDGPFDDLASNIGGNPGVAVDLGATYLSDDKRWWASASVSDLGAIFWNDKNSSIIQTHSGGRTFDFYGVDGLNGLINGTTDLGHVLDSAYNDFSATLNADTTAGKFTQMLPTRVQLSGTYRFDQAGRHHVSAGYIGLAPYKGKWYSAVSAGYAYRTLSGVWQLMGNYTYKSGDPFNIGVGVVMTTGCFQLFLGTDNVIPFCGLAGAKDATFSWGLNFFLGRNKKKQIFRYRG